ncbi:substrate-binding domain-containing protein [bacterium]|nr:substrate-binding domain-containing protein [bacterium]
MSLVDQTVEMIRQLISSQRWTDLLPGEETMRAQLGISRVTLRKALAELAEQGWITFGGRGSRHVVNSRPDPRMPVFVGEGVVRCLSQYSDFELAWSTRIIVDEIRKSLLIRERRLEFIQRVSLWRGDPAARLSRLTEEPGTAGWILYRASISIQQWFQQSHLPCVILGPCHEGVNLSSVEIDDEALGRHLAAEASRLGHHHVAYVVFDPGVASSLSTLAGLRQLRPKDGRLGKVTVINDDGSVSFLRNALGNLMSAPDPPTLLVVTEAVQALPVMGIMREMGLEIPDDVSMVVRDHEPFLDRSIPEFSRYTFDWLRFGRTAGKLIGDMIDSGGRKLTRRKLLPDFIPGGTLIQRRKD